MSIAFCDEMANQPQPSTASAAEHNFHSLLRDFDRAMLVTQTGDKTPRARPMAIADRSDDGSIWFLTGADTSKIDELKQDDTVLAVMQSAARWLSVTGHAALQRDPAHIKRLWKEAFKIWFKGPDDPNIVLIRLIPSEAEYWDNSGMQGLRMALKSAAAYVTGKELRDSDDVNAHAKVPL
jgi:general stress protein 26